MHCIKAVGSPFCGDQVRQTGGLPAQHEVWHLAEMQLSNRIADVFASVRVAVVSREELDGRLELLLKHLKLQRRPEKQQEVTWNVQTNPYSTCRPKRPGVSVPASWKSPGLGRFGSWNLTRYPVLLLRTQNHQMVLMFRSFPAGVYGLPAPVLVPLEPLHWNGTGSRTEPVVVRMMMVHLQRRKWGLGGVR